MIYPVQRAERKSPTEGTLAFPRYLYTPSKRTFFWTKQERSCARTRPSNVRAVKKAESWQRDFWRATKQLNATRVPIPILFTNCYNDVFLCFREGKGLVETIKM